MKRLLVLVVSFALTTSPALAAHWTVDRAKSHLGFTVRWSGEPFVGTFKSWSADIDFDPNDLAHSHVVATIDLASEASDTPDNDDGLKGPEGFSIAQFPKARFETTGFIHANGESYVATGNLSLHGVTRPVSLHFALKIAGNSAHVAGGAQVLRTDFGLGKGEWAAPNPVAHEVTIDLELTATKSP